MQQFTQILILGGTGYLGKRIIKKLLSENDQIEIICVIRKQSDISCLSEIDRIQFFVYEPQLLSDLFIGNRIYEIIDCCTTYERDGATEKEIYEANFRFPLDILMEAALYGVKRFLNVGTSLPKQINLYSFTKRDFVEFGNYICKRNDISFINIELENFFGPNPAKGNFIGDSIQKLKMNQNLELTNGEQKRDFIYIDDVVEGIYCIWKAGLIGIHSIPLGSGESISIKELVIYLKDLTNSTSLLQYGKIEKANEKIETKANLEQIEKLGFRLKHSLMKRLEQLIAIEMKRL